LRQSVAGNAIPLDPIATARVVLVVHDADRAMIDGGVLEFADGG